MFDARLRPLIDPPLNRMAAWIAARGISANALTVIGFVIGLAAVPALAAGLYWVAFFLIGFNRLADGLDGPVARARPEGSSEVGGFLDITLDFLFYGAIVVGFALADPARNALPAAVLLFCFIGTGSSFLAFAIIAAKHDLTTEAQGKKGIYYLVGLTEGAETIGFFILFCLFPDWFPILAYIFAGLCAVTVVMRILIGVRMFKDL